MKHLSIFLKPSSGLCNLNCTYCFYNETETKKLHTTFMEIDTFKSAIRKATDIAESVTVSFQGGEPLLIGIEFYKEVLEYTKSLKTKLHFNIQTNGTLITEDFAKLFKEYNFLVGVSVDGSKRTHLFQREKFDQSYKGIEILRQYKVNFNILTVITNHLVDNLDEVLSFYENEFDYLQFIPCLDKDGESFLTKENYEKFLKISFEFYYKKYLGKSPVSIQFFDHLVNRYLGFPPTICTMQGRCSTQFVIEANGDTYSCDFYVDNEHSIGNINKQNYKEMFESKVNQEFLIDSMDVHQKCKTCKFYELCKGGCKKDQIQGLNKYCDVLYNFYEYSQTKFNDIANDIRGKL